jgi:hypothetical protein
MQVKELQTMLSAKEAALETAVQAVKHAETGKLVAESDAARMVLERQKM